MIRLRRPAVVLGVLLAAGLGASAAPAGAQTSSGEFNYSPEAQERGLSVTITGKCLYGGSASNVDLIVTVQEGSSGDGSYGFSKAFLPNESGAINGTIEVPGEAPYGAYVIGGACRSGRSIFFSKNGPFAVVLDAPTAATTTTTTKRSTTTTSPTSTTTSTTIEESPPTSTIEIAELPEAVDTGSDTTSTTLDEFAGTRNDDDDSIGPLLLLIGVLPLALAVGAITLALRRNRNVSPDPS